MFIIPHAALLVVIIIITLPILVDLLVALKKKKLRPREAAPLLMFLGGQCSLGGPHPVRLLGLY